MVIWLLLFQKYGAGTDRSLVRVTAADQIGLLWAISDWFARHGVSIESLDASTTDGVAHDTFLISGTFLGSDLSRYLTGGDDPPPPKPDQQPARRRRARRLAPSRLIPRCEGGSAATVSTCSNGEGPVSLRR